jgi:hypothetical protein
VCGLKTKYAFNVFGSNRDAVYAVIREKRKEHNNKIKELQKADREKKAQLEKEKRIKLKKEQRNKALQELSQAYKDELALCDRLTAALVNRQSKQKTVAKEGADGESVEEKEAKKEEVEGEEGEEGNDNEEHEDEEKDETTAAEEEEEGTEAAPKAPKKKRAFQFTMATHIDFELLSVQPPTSLDEIPAALDSISRKKVRAQLHFLLSPTCACLCVCVCAVLRYHPILMVMVVCAGFLRAAGGRQAGAAKEA